MGGRFYVYDIYDESDEVIYVGKGCNNRVRQSLANHAGAYSKIVKRFNVEADAYEFEADRIEQLKPRCNKISGGSGGWCDGHQPKDRWSDCAIRGLAFALRHPELGIRIGGHRVMFSEARPISVAESFVKSIGFDRANRILAQYNVVLAYKNGRKTQSTSPAVRKGQDSSESVNQSLAESCT